MLWRLGVGNGCRVHGESINIAGPETPTMEELVTKVAEALGAFRPSWAQIRVRSAVLLANRLHRVHCSGLTLDVFLGAGMPQPQFAHDKPAFFPSVSFGAISV